MGVPALFRWLSKKYPKIICPVEEEEDMHVPDAEGNTITVPVNMAASNPNGVEFDNLYLDMNGIVHPCTHPEGKPPPETEEDMMVEVFKYTERVVNMVRPRKLLFMAIDGVAPRAKMNQQRSRRFRSAQEAKEKEEAHKESIALWEAMGKTVSAEEKNKKSWDSNAITPGTPFMDLLASSLRYWVVQKMNTDKGWKNIQVIISDASVPGEGEHKIMDFIRRSRTNPGHDPNTRHVIYGLDADLIMLSLATHEPYFRVLREDVFANDTSPNACRICGQQGHYAAQCTGTKAEVVKKPPSDKKPFIFLDVAILREYLEVELYVPEAPFPFALEQAIDDWVLLIFFVGNDFLPHLPSLEIREGAVDTLLKIWKKELPRMGGYLTNNGQIELSRAQIILEGLAQREDDIFKRRREAEERQDQNAKRRKLDMNGKNGDNFASGPSPALGLSGPPPVTSSTVAHPSLPQRPVGLQDFAANANALGLGATPTASPMQVTPMAIQALAGSNRDVVANRRAIRMANMSAAEVLRAELSGKAIADMVVPLKPSASGVISTHAAPAAPPSTNVPDPVMPGDQSPSTQPPESSLTSTPTNVVSTDDSLTVGGSTDADGDADASLDPDISMKSDASVSAGTKRKLGEATENDETEDVEISEEEEAPADAGTVNLALKVRPDGTVEQEDHVRLWESGYRERYYRQKFGVEPSDSEFKKKITKYYVEGLAWVLHYYYQGTPSWQWYYPYHFAPFAADFEEVDKMAIQFTQGAPFKPFEQLMGVFPAASRKHIPEAYQHLMVDESSPIIDFYPTSFEIDMNGKKMAWQGVALLPFIDQTRLLDAMALHTDKLTEEEKRRNSVGNNVVFAAEDHPIYPFYEKLYGKRKSQEPVPIDFNLSKGLNGTVLPNPDCLPGSTYFSPLMTRDDLPDIKNDRSLSVLYFFPKQLQPHKSVLLAGVKKPPRVLSAADLEVTRNGGRRGRGGGPGDRDGGRNGYNSTASEVYGRDMRSDAFHSRPNRYGSGRGGGYGGYDNGSRGGYNNNRSGGYGGYDGGHRSGPPPRGGSGRGGSSYSQNNDYNNSRAPYQQGPQSHGGYGGYGGAPNRGPPSYGGYGGSGGRGGSSSSRGGGQSNYSGGGSYGSSNYNQTNYGGYGNAGPGYNTGSRTGYGDFGVYGSSGGVSNYNQPAGGYQNQPPRGGAPHRGRGRGW